MRTQIYKWLPALTIMILIFGFSAQPGSDLPAFGWADLLIKKGAHMLGYALLAFAYWRAFEFKGEMLGLAWFFAVLYAVTDEFHQSFVPGRHPSAWDILIFDNFGALISLCLSNLYRKAKRPGPVRPVVGEAKR